MEKCDRKWSESDVAGGWRLVSFVIKKTDGTILNWGKAPHGLLIYTKDGLMSVAINGEIEGDTTSVHNIFRSILFYSGTYRVEPTGLIRHHVSEASDPSRIGKEMLRSAKQVGDLLILTASGGFGEATLTWKKQ